MCDITRSNTKNRHNREDLILKQTINRKEVVPEVAPALKPLTDREQDILSQTPPTDRIIQIQEMAAFICPADILSCAAPDGVLFFEYCRL